VLGDDGGLVVDQGGEQVQLVAVGVAGAADGLAVQGEHQGGELAGRQAPGADLGVQPSGDRGVQGVGADRADRPAQGLVGRGQVGAGAFVAPDPEGGQGGLGQGAGVLGDRAGGVRPREHRCGGDREQRRQVVADAAGLAVLGHLTQHRQQPAGSVDIQGVHVHNGPASVGMDEGGVERGGQHGEAVAVQRAQPIHLRPAVADLGAAVAGVPGAGPDREEAGRGVAGAGVPDGVGEGLHGQHRLAPHRQVVGGQPAQAPAQHRRGQMRATSRGQYTQPLVGGDQPEPAQPQLPVPTEEFLPRRTGQGRGPETGQRHPLVIDRGQVAQHPPGQPMPQPMMDAQLRVEPLQLVRRDRPDDQ
jgi:hypothetical protein